MKGGPGRSNAGGRSGRGRGGRGRGGAGGRGARTDRIATGVKGGVQKRGGKTPVKPAAGGRGDANSRSAGKPPAGKPDRPKPSAPEKLTAAERRERARSKKLKFKKNFAVIQECVSLWEKLRPHDVAAGERRALVQRVLDTMRGQLAALANNHAASRVVQAVIKYGDDAQRAMVLSELKPHLLDLARAQYGHFCVRKLIAAPKQDLSVFTRAFKGRFVPLLRHPCGCTVVDDLYTQLRDPQRDALVAEFYGPEFALFEGGAPKSLASLLASSDPPRRRTVMQHLATQVLPLAEKALLDPAPTHRALAEFMDHAGPLEVYDIAEMLSGPQLLRILHTRDGARVACRVVAAGTARDRKRVARAFKGHLAKVAMDEWGHTVLLTLLCMTDDTQLLRKAILPELMAVLSETLTHPHARRIVLQLLAPDCPSYVPRWMQEWVHPAEVRVSEADSIARHRAELAKVAGTAGKGKGRLPIGHPARGTDGEGNEEHEHDHEHGHSHHGHNHKHGHDHDHDHDHSHHDHEHGDGHSGSEEEESGEGGSGSDREGGDDGESDGGGSGEGPSGSDDEPSLDEGGEGNGHEDKRGLWSDEDDEGPEGGEGGDDGDGEGLGVAEDDEGEEGGGWRVGAIYVARKDPALRRRELLGSGAGSLGAAVVAECQARAGELMRDRHGCEVALEVARGGAGGVLAEEEGCGCGDGVAGVREAVVGECAQEGGKLMEDFFVSRALRRVLRASVAEDEGCGRALCAALWGVAVKGRAGSLAKTHAAKVVAALATCGDEKTVKAVRQELARGLPGGDVDAWLATFEGRGKEGEGGGGDGEGGTAEKSEGQKGGKQGGVKRGRKAEGGGEGGNGEGASEGARGRGGGGRGGRGKGGRGEKAGGRGRGEGGGGKREGGEQGQGKGRGGGGKRAKRG